MSGSVTVRGRLGVGGSSDESDDLVAVGAPLGNPLMEKKQDAPKAARHVTAMTAPAAFIEQERRKYQIFEVASTKRIKA